MFTQICIPLYQFKLQLIKCKRLHCLTLICRNTGSKPGTFFSKIILESINIIVRSAVSDGNIPVKNNYQQDMIKARKNRLEQNRLIECCQSK